MLFRSYEIFADFKALHASYFWNKMVADAIAETFFLGWIDEHVLLIQGEEEHLEALREAWMRRSLKPPHGFDIKYLGNHHLHLRAHPASDGTAHGCVPNAIPLHPLIAPEALCSK